MQLNVHWKPGYWRAMRERGLLREWLGLQQWLALPDADRHTDNTQSLQAVAAQVLACEHDGHGRTDSGFRSDNFGTSDDGGTPDEMATAIARQRLQQIHRHLQHAEPLAPAESGQHATWRQQRRQLRRQVIADTKFFQLPLEQLRDAIPYLTAFFFLSGYVIVAYYLGHFGIRVSRYFSLWDYISSSIDALRGLLIALLFSGGAMLLAFRRAKLRLLQQALGVHRALAWMHWLILGVGGVLIGWAWFHDERWLMTAVIATAFHVLIFITPKFFMYLRQPLRMMFIASFLTIYSVYIINAINGSIDFASRPFSADSPLFWVTFASDEPAGRYRVLAGNSQWLFLQNEALQVKAVSIEQVFSVEVMPPQLESSPESAE